MDKKERKMRSIIKTISYRVLIIISDIIILYAITRRMDLTIGITSIANIIRTFLYYAHERVWNKITWGNGTVVQSQ